jgi:hypothetical protein
MRGARSFCLTAGARILDALEALGYCETFDDPHSYTSMHLTDAGAELAEEAFEDEEDAREEGVVDGEEAAPWREGDDDPLKRAPKAKAKKMYSWSRTRANAQRRES